MSDPASRRSNAAVLGCAGLSLTSDERSFFRDADPLGFILFTRNCETPDQVSSLISDLRECVGRDDAPILIDQEGGRVARLRPPHWRDMLAAARFVELAKRAPETAEEAVYLNNRLTAEELRQLGVSVNCTPVLDLPQPNADPIIGDRAFGTTPEQVVRLAEMVCRGMLDGAVAPVIKHIPGHGRALVDSHEALPVVEAERKELENHDFAPFEALNTMPWAMTAHVIYSAFDPENPATLSQSVVHDVIRTKIGFDGLLITDDLSMKALGGDYRNRAKRALAAGCDVVLHCNGKPNEMEAVMEGCTSLTEEAESRFKRAEDLRKETYVPIDKEAAEKRLAELLQ